MRLDSLRHFFELISPERLEEYLRAHGYEPAESRMPKEIGQWWRKSSRVEVSFVPVATREAGDRVNRLVDAVSDLATAEKRLPTAVLFDLLPDDDARRALVDELLPDAGRVISVL